MYFVVCEPFNFTNKEDKENLREKLMINYLPLIKFAKISAAKASSFKVPGKL